MTDFPSRARVVIIGGGAVGCSIAWHLAKAGWSDVVLLERNELTSGSTWHAAGNCPNFSAGWGVMRLQNYSTRLYATLGEEVDYPMNYHVTGSVRLAHSTARMQEYARVVEMAANQGFALEMASVSDLQRMHPCMEFHDLEGGLWDATDGDIDPAQLTQAFAKGARDLGVKIVRFCPVTGLTRGADGWRVETPKGEIACEIVVNAAGYYAPDIGRMMGREIPSAVLAHQYLVTGPIAELAARKEKLPLLRDPDVSYYLRQERDGLLLGPYEFNCRAHWTGADDRRPDDFSFQLYPDDLERLETYIEDACARVPLLGSVGVQKVINGPIPYAPDGNPLIGPVPGVPGAFEACVFTFGIVQAGGAGKVMADWITEGETEWDMWSVDPRRFTGFATKSFTLAKAIEVYSHEYAMHFSHHEWPAGRPAKTSALHDRLKAKGAQFGLRGGWEKPTWFAKPGDKTAAETWARPSFHARIGEEVRAVHEGVGVMDMTAFGRQRLSGPGAAAALDAMICGPLPRVGRLTLSYFLDGRGRVVTEMTVARLAEEEFWLLGAAGAQWHDRDLIAAGIAGHDARLVDETSHWATLAVVGPKSRDLLARVADCDLSNAAFPWLSHQPVEVGPARGIAMRVNYVGELGWELHVPPETLVGVYELLMEAGGDLDVADFGGYATESMRLEKCYRSWKGDLSSDFTPLTGALDRFVRFDKGEFTGRDALLAEKAAGSAELFRPLIVETDIDAPYLSTVWSGETRVGLVTSCGYGFRIGATVALAYVRADLATPGTALEVDVFGVRKPATVAAEPLFDPTNARLRA